MTSPTRIRRVVNRFLVHRYTHVPQQEGAPDFWDDTDDVPTTPVIDRKCQFSNKTAYTPTEQGVVLVQTPTLTVAWNDPIKVEDLVKNVRTRSGQILLTGPAIVETVDPVAEAGESVEKILTLRIVEVDS